MFFILPVGVDYDARRYPVVTFTLMGICTAVWLLTFVLGLLNGEAVHEWVYTHLWLTPAESNPWTYFTMIFVHGGLFHLLGNMAYLFLFGSCVEDIIGRVHFAIFFLAAGVLSGFGQIMLSPAHFASEIPVGGASGAISACIGGFALLLWRARIEFKWVFFLLVRVFSGDFYLPAWLVISFWFGSDLLGVVASMGQPEEGGGVAFGAHVGGFVAGLGFIALAKLRLRHGQEDTNGRLARATPAEPADTLLFMNGEQCGPFSMTQVREMIALGSVPADALYWREGMPDWGSVAEWRD